MKKKILLVASMVILLVCLLAICVSAETVLKPQSNNAYGEISFFDESVSVGRTNGANGFTPYIDAENTDYARVVIGDGTTFYTFPTAYILSNTTIYGSSGKNILVPDFTSLNTAMQGATNTNPNWTAQNVYRIEMPVSLTRFNGGNQNFGAWEKVIEIYLQPNSGIQDQGKSMMFWHCYELETIHNLDTFVFRKGCLGGAFQDCKKLKTLTIGYSPEVVHTDNSTFNNCYLLTSVNFVEAFPNIVEIGQNVFQNCYALTTINPTDQPYTFKLQSGIKYINHNAFQNCDSVKAIKFSGSYVQLRQNVFNSLDNLEYIYFPKNSELKISDCEVFSSNPKLKAFALPDNCVSLPDRGFKNCPLLEAVYLPANVQTFVCNGWDQAPFSSNAMLYFVNDWFNVLDENGDFLFESFDMPERPDVYYFPETLSALCTNKTSGTIFLNCYNINPYLVFGTKVTQITVNDGLLINCGTRGETKTAIFLGDMTLVCHSTQDSRLNNIQYVFANPNDKSVADVTITSNNSRVPADSSKIFFCATNTSYKMIGSGGTYGNDLGGAHFTDTRKTKTTEATCTTIAGTTYYCFCGAKTGEEKTADALGHLKSEIVLVVYGGASTFFEKGDTTYLCERCEENHTVEGDASEIFKARGISYTEGKTLGYALIQGFIINRDAMDTYNAHSEKDIVGFGLVAGTKRALGENAEVFDNTGAVTNQKAAVANIGARAEKYDIMEMRVGGLDGSAEGIGDFADLEIYCCGYWLVQNGESVDSFYANEGVVTETLSYTTTYNTVNPPLQ